MQLFRVVCNWQGQSVVGQAVTVLHFDGTNQTAPPVAAVVSAFTAVKASLPGGVTVTVPNSGEIIDDTTGHLAGVWSGTGGATVTGSGYPNTAAGVGACVGWTTGGIVNGKKGPRRLRGRTFIVPLQANAYDPTGTLADADLANVRAFAGTLLNAGGFGIWHRPTTVGGTDGSSSSVLSYNVRDKVAYLSSRRD